MFAKLPMLVGQQGCVCLYVSDVLGIREMSPIGAAALNQLRSRASQHSLAPPPKDALIAAHQPRHIESPDPVFLRVLERDPLMHILGSLRAQLNRNRTHRAGRHAL